MSRVIDFVRQQVGKPYVFATSGPDSFDCSGLTLRAAKKIGLNLYHGASTQWARGHQEGAGEVYGYWGASGTIDTLPDKVAFLFNQDRARTDKIVMAHTGLYDGQGRVIQAGGYGGRGVHDNPVDRRRWSHWATLNDYWTGVDADMALVKGAEGSAVKAMQDKLTLLGYDLGKWGADGKFGAVTESAIRAFQADHALPVTGTWDEHDQAIADDSDEGINDPEPIDYTALANELAGIADRLKVIAAALEG